MTGRRLGLTIGLGLAACLLLGRVAAGWLVEFRWYEAMGASSVFWVTAGNLLLLRGAAFVAGTLLCFANFYAVRFSIVSVVLPRRVGNLEIAEELHGRTLAITVLVLSVILGGLLSLPQGDWVSLDLVRHGETFRESDPYFGFDLAFWVYWLPIEESFHAWATLALLVVTGVVLALYALTPSLRWEQGRLRATGHVRRHMFVLVSLLLLLLAWSYRLDALGLLLDGEGSGRAFLALDHRVGIPTRLVLAMACVVTAMLVAWAGWVGQLRVAIGALAVLGLAALTAQQVLPSLASRFMVPADPELRERPYRATRAAFSRRAFHVDGLEVGDSLRVGASLDAPPGIAVWDTEAIQRSVSRWSVSGPATGTVGWMQVGGRPTALLVQRAVGQAPADRPTIALLQAASAGADGHLLPEAPSDEVLRTLPPVAVGDSLPEGSVVSDSSNAIAAPTLETFAARVVHAWGLQNPRLLRASSTYGPARLVRVRDVRTRVGRIFPFFVLGNRTLPIIVGDSLLWAVHLYGASAHYPLSEPIVLATGDVSYFRHAGVALVNAHTGRVHALRAADPDPLARSWYRRLPALFRPPGSAEEEVLRHLPPAVDEVLAQARAFARFGRRGDALVAASQISRDTGADSGFAFPGLSPFVDRRLGRLGVAYPVVDPTDRLRGVVVGSGGGDGRSMWRPLQEGDLHWRDLVGKLRRSLDSAGSAARGEAVRVLRGPVRVAVDGRDLVAIQAAYQWPTDRAPVLRWVAAIRGDSVSVGRTLEAALGFPEPVASTAPMTPEAFRRRVADLYEAMDEALGRRDMAAFGEAWTALGRILRGSPRAP